jgi:hypothetical protein
MNAISGFHVRAVPVARHTPATRIEAVRQCWRRLTAAVLDPYRPELHYMRGPGPKWRAKHAHDGAVRAPADPQGPLRWRASRAAG